MLEEYSKSMQITRLTLVIYQPPSKTFFGLVTRFSPTTVCLTELPLLFVGGLPLLWKNQSAPVCCITENRWEETRDEPKERLRRRLMIYKLFSISPSPVPEFSSNIPRGFITPVNP